MKQKPMMTSVLPENCALKALRAGSLVLNDRKLTLVDNSARISNKQLRPTQQPRVD